MKLTLVPSPYAIAAFNERGGKGPGALLAAGLDAALKKDGHDVVTVPPRRPAIGSSDQVMLAAHLRETARFVKEARAQGRLPVVLGGDCLVAIAVIAALPPRPTVVYFDAHGDFNDEKSTPSGYLPGMPLAAVCGRSLKALCKDVGLDRFVDPAQVTLCGVRDLDEKEKAVLDGLPLRRVPPKSIDLFSAQKAPSYLHFDLDVLDPSVAPGVSHPAPGGLQVVEAITAARKAPDRLAVSLTTLVPEHDRDGVTARAAIEVLRGVLA